MEGLCYAIGRLSGIIHDVVVEINSRVVPRVQTGGANHQFEALKTKDKVKLKAVT